MRKADWKDLDNMVNVLTISFRDDPHVAWFTGNPKSPVKAEKKRRVLMEYLCTAALSTGLAYVSHNSMAVALWQRRGAKPSGRAFLMANLKYLFVCGIKPTILSLGMESRAASYFPPGPYLFLWSIGILPEAQGSGLFKAMVAPMLKKAEKTSCPVMLETTIDRNVAIYQHYGFETRDRYAWAKSPTVHVMAKG